MSTPLPRPMDRRFAQEVAARYTAHLRAEHERRRLSIRELAERYESDRIPRFRIWIDGCLECLDSHAAIDEMQGKAAVLHLKARIHGDLRVSERLCERRLERKILGCEAVVARTYEELYRSAVMLGRRTERDSTDRRFYEELSRWIGDARQALESPVQTMKQRLSAILQEMDYDVTFL